MRVKLGMGVLALIFVTSTPAFAQQSSDGCAVAGQFLGALLGTSELNPCKASPRPSNVPQAQPSYRPIQVDSKENIDILREALAVQYRALSLESPDGDNSVLSCEAEMIQRWPQYQNESRWSFLEDECRRIKESMERQYRHERSDHYGRKRREEAQKVEAAAKADQERALAQSLADLQSGKRPPANCDEYMITQGRRLGNLSTAVMFPALEAPKGESFFIGNANEISGSNIVLTSRPLGLYQGLHRVPDNSVLKIGTKTKVFRGDLISTGTVVKGVATQTGTSKVTLVSGASATIAIMQATCVQPG